MLKPRMFLGLNTAVYKNICYISKNEILYPVGSVIVIHNFEHKSQRYINLPNPEKCVSVIAVSSKGKYLAVAEKGLTGEKPKIHLFDLETLKRKTTLNIPFDIATEEIMRLTFTHDSNYLAALTGGSDYIMYYYNWKSGKIESQTRANNPPSVPGPVTDMAINPKDATIVVFVGVSLFRLLSMSENVWRQYGFQRAQNFSILSVCWLTDDRVLAGCKDGKVMIIQSGDLNGIYDINDTEMIQIIPSIDSKKDQMKTLSRSFSKQLSVKQLIKKDKCNIRCVTPVPTGFLYSSKPGEVVYFSKTSKTSYKKSTAFCLKQDIENPDMKYDLMYCINSLCVSIDGLTILCTTSRSQIYWAPLQDSDTIIEFNIFEESLHHGSISGLSTCLWKPIFMTCGKFDNSVRIWNYIESKLLLSQTFIETVYSISLHPTGLFALIGFSDNVRYFKVLIQELQIYREFGIAGCKILQFSNNGHLFAAECDNDILVFSSISFQNVANFQAHYQEITSLRWSFSDQILYSCSINGAYYEWNIDKKARVSDVVLQNVNMTGLISLNNGKTICVGFDGNIIEINNDKVVSNVKLDNERAINLKCVTALEKSECNLILAGKNGVIIVLNYPIVEEPQFDVYLIHNRPLTQFNILQEGHSLVSTDTDGNICLWDIISSDLSKDQKSTENFFTEILINVDELHDINVNVKHLTSRISEMVSEHSFEIKQKENSYFCNTRELEENYSNQIQSLKKRIKTLEKEHSMELNRIHLDINQMKQTHTSQMDQMDSNFNAKLLYEFQKYDNLKQEIEAIRNDYDRKLSELQRVKDMEIEIQRTKFETEIRTTQSELTENKYTNEKESFEKTMSTIKENFETKLKKQQDDYEASLKQRDNTSSSLRTELGIIKKKLTMIQKEREELKAAQSSSEIDFENIKHRLNDTINQMNTIKFEKNKIKEQLEEQKRHNTKLKHKIEDLNTINENIEEEKNKLEILLKEKHEDIIRKDEEIAKISMKYKQKERENSQTEIKFAQMNEKQKIKELTIKKKIIEIQDLQTQIKNIVREINSLEEHIQNFEKLKFKVKGLREKYGT